VEPPEEVNPREDLLAFREDSTSSSCSFAADANLSNISRRSSFAGAFVEDLAWIIVTVGEEPDEAEEDASEEEECTGFVLLCGNSPIEEMRVSRESDGEMGLLLGFDVLPPDGGPESKASME